MFEWHSTLYIAQAEKATQSVQPVSDKATQSVLMEKKDTQEEVVKDEIYAKNVSQALPLRRSGRAARRAIVKVNQVEF